MADYRAAARQAAARYGLDPNVFVRQIQQESGFNPTIRSGAGAVGIAQIMPATARGWGVDPLDPIASLNAAAKNMAGYVKKYGGYENALRAYNAGPGAIQASKGYAETNNYVKTILGGRDPGGLSKTSARTKPQSTPAEPVAAALQTLGGGSFELPQRPQIQVTAPAAPAFAAGVTLAGAAPPASAREAPARLDAQGALAAIGQLQTQAPQLLSPNANASATGGGKAASTKTGGTGKFKISGPQPERLKPVLTSFAAKVADVFGGTLTGSDGSSHSKYTVNGNVSEHYTGNATDIFTINGKPATGARLIAAGRAALIAAGMPRAKALKAPGGLYNVGSHQIIFGVNGTQYGGNHLDHLHISAR
jgi:hypothetical protein